MKKVLSFLFVLFFVSAGVVFALDLTSGKAAMNANAARQTAQWFTYNGGDINSSSSYSPAGGTPGCTDGTTICAVRATTNSSNQPVLTDQLKTEMQQALDDGTASANVKLRD